jgi:competence protein ComEC
MYNNKMSFTKRTIKILWTVTVLVTAAAWYAWNYQTAIIPTGVILSISFLDVGQGDAIYIRTPNQTDVLIDGGPDDSVINDLHQVMPSSDQDLDFIVETHPDKDHIAGLSDVLEQYHVKKFLHSEITSGTSFDISLRNHAAEEVGLEQIVARRGQRIILDPQYGIYLDILFPDRDTSNFKETNDASIVARLVYGETSFLLTGDSPSSVEHTLVQTGEPLSSTVLKLGHHGSKTSSSDEYLDAVHPSYAIVSAGKNNRYHHPNPETVSRVTSRGIQILSTIDQGTITMESNGKSVWVK